MLHSTPLPSAEPQYPANRTIASLQQITKNYDSIQALKRVDLSIRSGELLAVLGPNGAGKTTIVRLLLGLVSPTAGRVRVFGEDPRYAATRLHTGAMLQVSKVPETLRVREHIDLFSSYYPSPLPLSRTLALAGLNSIKDRTFGDLSGGQRQRVLFALAICGNPDLLFLDEPTVGMDVEARRALWEQIRNLVASGKTVLLTTHYLHEADALADRIVVINKGSIVAEGPANIKAQTSGRRIRCVTQLNLDQIRRIHGVLDVHQDREAIEIRALQAESVLRGLLLQDGSVSGVEVTSPGLEDAFLALTRTANHSPEVMQ